MNDLELPGDYRFGEFDEFLELMSGNLPSEFTALREEFDLKFRFLWAVIDDAAFLPDFSNGIGSKWSIQGTTASLFSSWHGRNICFSYRFWSLLCSSTFWA